MSKSHLEAIRKSLEQKHWIINEELEFKWKISRPDQSSPLTIVFDEWYGDWGMWTETSIDKSISCEVKELPDLKHLYFSKLSRGFPKRLIHFIDAINQSDKKNKRA